MTRAWAWLTAGRVAAALGLAAVLGMAHAAFARSAWADIVIFEHADFRGQSVRVGGVIPNLQAYGFNDRVSSIRVFEGTWELCEHANFQGRCVVIDRDVYDLTRIHFNDQISSIRPVRPRNNNGWNDDGRRRGWGK